MQTIVKGPDFKILGILSKLAQNNINKEVLETEIIALSGLSESEARNRLNDLEWLHLAKEALPNARRPEFRLWNVAEKGLKESILKAWKGIPKRYSHDIFRGKCE